MKDLTLNAFLAVVGTAEAGSEHPIAKAVSSYAKQLLESDSLGTCENFKAVSGCGLSCEVKNIGTVLNNLLSGKVGHDMQCVEVQYVGEVKPQEVSEKGWSWLILVAFFGHHQQSL